MKSLPLLVIALAGALLSSGSTFAQVLVHGLTRGKGLVSFVDRAGPVVEGAAIKGLREGEQPLSLDVRPFTGGLYLVTRDEAGLGRLYTVDRASGQVTEIPLAGAPFMPVGGLDMDFNPAALSGTNALRVVTSSGQNFRMVFTVSGATVNADGSINGGGGASPRLVATAYTRNVSGLPGGGGVGGTAQYALDSGTDTLYRVNPPNSGTLVDPKPLGLDIGDPAALDVVTGSDRALALLQVGGQSGLYDVDLVTGQATRLRDLPDDVISIAAALPVAVIAEAAIGLATSNRLMRIPFTAAPVESGPAVTGLADGDELLSLDFRPRDGMLYGLARGSSGMGRLYTVDARTGQATEVMLSGAELVIGTGAAIDFNPVALAGVNALRILTAEGLNYRLVFGPQGAVVNVDGAVNGAGEGVQPRVVATAYTNNRGGMPGATGSGGTLQYAVDAATASLYRVNPPNNGTLTERRPLPMAVGDRAGLDVITGSDRLIAMLDVEGRKAVYELDGKLGLLGRVRDVPESLIDLAFPVPVTLATPAATPGGWRLDWVGGVGPFTVEQRGAVGAAPVRVEVTDTRTSTLMESADPAVLWQVLDHAGATVVE
ncbi:MAG: DUF4394 domain-containing protein [Verrucomicrobiales bacterium]|nr:DUF4394 domain-containing protein [Verrucomicrobiales bacterium]